MTAQALHDGHSLPRLSKKILVESQEALLAGSCQPILHIPKPKSSLALSSSCCWPFRKLRNSTWCVSFRCCRCNASVGISCRTVSLFFVVAVPWNGQESLSTVPILPPLPLLVVVVFWMTVTLVASRACSSYTSSSFIKVSSREERATWDSLECVCSLPSSLPRRHWTDPFSVFFPPSRSLWLSLSHLCCLLVYGCHCGWRSPNDLYGL